MVSYSKNQGLGYALSRGLPVCRNEIVARMDSDDYAFPTRMEEQLALMEERDLDMVGSQIVEFVKDPEHPVAASTLPVSSDEIVAYSKKRNPFRHPSMVFKKSKAMEAGNYSGEFLYFEDWDLFNRMLAIGCKAWNIDHPLVAMRVSADFYGRVVDRPICRIFGSSRLHSSNADISPLVSSWSLLCLMWQCVWCPIQYVHSSIPIF